MGNLSEKSSVFPVRTTNFLSDQPARQRSLVSTFFVCCLDNILDILHPCNVLRIQLVSVAQNLEFETHSFAGNGEGFIRDVAAEIKITFFFDHLGFPDIL